jgi:hypothetical protein
MGILDDAIREHLDLKRKHGARDSEISEIEDEAFGSGDRPDPFAAGELFGGVPSPAPEMPEGAGAPATPPPAGPDQPPPGEEPTAVVGPRQPTEPPSAPPEPASAPPEPSFPEPPATAPPDRESPASAPPEPSFPQPPERAQAEEPAAAEPPGESESLEELMAQEESEPAQGDVVIPPPPPPPPETDLAARPGAEPEPPPPPSAATEGQRGRARGRADVPTQEHIPPRRQTGEAAPVPSEPGPAPSEPAGDAGPQLYDFETDPDLVAEEGADLGTAPPQEESDDFEALGPVEEDTGDDLYLEDEEHYAEGGGVAEAEEAEPEEVEEERYDTEVRPAEPGRQDDDDDLLSESPEFLEQDTDSEGLWFEKGPPQDFDFEDEEEEQEEER